MIFAKTSPPILPPSLSRQRLFDLLDDLSDRKAIWVQGIPGSGKTTLVENYSQYRKEPALWYRIDSDDDDPATTFHYLTALASTSVNIDLVLPKFTPDALANLELFSRHFFRVFFQMVSAHRLLVFDNYQEASNESPLHRVMISALEEVPRELRVVFVSRNAPPSLLARLRLNRELAIIEPHQLKLTIQEANDLVQSFNSAKYSHSMASQLNQVMDGWVAGFVLSLSQDQVNLNSLQHSQSLNRQELFDYFANEAFNKLNRSDQQYLVKVAQLGEISAAMADQLTNGQNSEQRLESFYQSHLFIDKKEYPDTSYCFHPLYQDFLLNRASELLGESVFDDLVNKALALLIDGNKVPEALKLSVRIKNWSQLRHLINHNAPALLDQQRHKTLEFWLSQLPQKELEREGWLLCWKGWCHLPFDQKQSQLQFQTSHSTFCREGDRQGQVFTACGLVLAVLTEWDDFTRLGKWISELDELLDNHIPQSGDKIDALITLSMLGALLFHRPNHPMIDQWSVHAEKLLHEQQIDTQLRLDLGSILAHYQYWMGDLAAATRAIDVMSQLSIPEGQAHLPKLQAMMNQAIHCWHKAEFDQCLEIVENGLKLAGEADLHVMDDRLMAQGIYASLSQGDTATARRLLDSMKPVLASGRRLAVSHYYFLASYYSLTSRDIETARQQAEIALRLNREVGTPFPEGLTLVVLAQCQFHLADTSQAYSLLNDALAIANKINSGTLMLLCQFSLSWFELAQQNEQESCRYLENALGRLKRSGFINIPGWRREMMLPLLTMALEQQIEIPLVQKLIRQHQLLPDTGVGISDDWPWPVRIYTTGRFSLLVNDTPIVFSGKAQRRPMDLLKVLVALGGRDVSKEELIDALWPDAEGDKAYRALDTTLHRLRKLIGDDRVILLQDRKLSLNPSICWVDNWLIERWLGQLESQETTLSELNESDPASHDRLLAAYRGRFLPGDIEIHCVKNRNDKIQRRLKAQLETIS